METFTLIIRKSLLFIEFLTALVAIIYFSRLKFTYWKWFCVYLVFVFIQELVWYFYSNIGSLHVYQYYRVFGIPIQFLFFYWLYAVKSLKRKLLFVLFIVLYIISLLLEIYYAEFEVVYSLNMVVGALFLTVLVILEYIKQIKTDNILRFKTNKMFYINIGVVLFYVGTLPFFAFYKVLSKDSYLEWWNIYFVYFRISVCIMYILFICSFIWGKQPLK